MKHIKVKVTAMFLQPSGCKAASQLFFSPKIVLKNLLYLRNDFLVSNLQKYLLFHGNKWAIQVKLNFIKFKSQLGLAKINALKDKPEQGKCFCHSIRCFKCLSLEQFLGRNQILDRIICCKAKTWAIVKKYPEVNISRSNSISASYIWLYLKM